MAVIYGAIVLTMGVLGNELELVIAGLAMIFLGNLHRVGKLLLRTQKYALD
jgi:hypothetical protein